MRSSEQIDVAHDPVVDRSTETSDVAEQNDDQAERRRAAGAFTARLHRPGAQPPLHENAPVEGRFGPLTENPITRAAENEADLRFWEQSQAAGPDEQVTRTVVDHAENFTSSIEARLSTGGEAMYRTVYKSDTEINTLRAKYQHNPGRAATFEAYLDDVYLDDAKNGLYFTPEPLGHLDNTMQSARPPLWGETQANSVHIRPTGSCRPTARSCSPEQPEP